MSELIPALSSTPAIPLAVALQTAFAHIQDLHHSVFALSMVVGALANVENAGLLATPGAIKKIAGDMAEHFMPTAPRVAQALKAAIEMNFGTPPPDGGTHLHVVAADQAAA
jgi:hypothetical protein